MKHSAKAFWKKNKVAGEFTAGIVAIVAVLYGLSWVADDILAHAHIHLDHHWWAYRAWHAWWWVIAPIAMVAGGRLWHRQIIGKGLWVVGVLWLVFLGFGAGMALWGKLLMYLVSRFGWLSGGALTLAATAFSALGWALVGDLFDRARKRWPFIDGLKREICWMPNWQMDGK
jgi:hypothetical protein